MPEGHTIHRLARFLRRDLGGETVRSSALQPRFATVADQLDGRVLTGADAVGKHLLVRFDTTTVHVHLGLFGRFRRRRNPPPERRGALRWRLEGPERTWDLSGPTACEVMDPAAEDELVGRIGPDPLRPGEDPARFVERAARSRRAIAALLLDQAVVAGIGNVYRAELLAVRGVHPATPARALGPDGLATLWSDAVRQLRIGERLGRIVVVDDDVEGVAPGRVPRGDRLRVYRRERCRHCGSVVERSEIGGRTCYHCPTCQPG